MEAWEYRKSSGDADIEELGREGWELVAVVPSGTQGEATFYYKRPAPNLREQVTNDQKKRYYTQMGIKGAERT